MENSKEKKDLSIASFCDGAEQLLSIEAELTGAPIDSVWKEKLEVLKSGKFRIVVMGEIKKGKSSFVNALLGVENLVPVCDDVATSTVYQICYGEKQEYKVFFTEESRKPVQTISQDELAQYGTETGNPGNEKQVDYIQVFAPSPLLANGVEIFDTPGLGGIVKKHKEITYRLVPQADAVFVVTESCSSPLGTLELALLEDLKKVTDQIFFVQTKSALVSREEVETRKERNSQILIQRAGFVADSIKYFVVDSTIKTLADEDHSPEELKQSGFDQVLEFIEQTIQPNMNRLLLQRAWGALKPKVNLMLRIVNEREQINSEMSDETRKKMKEALVQAQEDAKNWENETLPLLRETFEKGMQNTQDEARLVLETIQQSSELYNGIINKIEEVSSLSELKELGATCETTLPEHFCDVYRKMMTDVTTSVQTLLQSFADNCLQLQKPVSLSSAPETEASSFVTHGKVVGNLDRYGLSVFEGGRSIIYGDMAGSSMGALVGSAVGSIVPGVGTAVGGAIGGFLGGLWGAKSSFSGTKEAKLESAKSSFKASITSWININCNKMQVKLTSVLNNLRLDCIAQINSIVRTVRKELENSIANLSRNNNTNIAELQKELAKYQNMKKRIGSSLNLMGITLK